MSESNGHSNGRGVPDFGDDSIFRSRSRYDAIEEAEARREAAERKRASDESFNKRLDWIQEQVNLLAEKNESLRRQLEESNARYDQLLNGIRKQARRKQARRQRAAT